MPKKVERALSPRFCQTAAVGFYCDGGGLYLQVTQRKDRQDGVSRSWIFRYRRARRLRDMGLGPFPLVTLAAARDRASACRLQLLDGVDPLDARRAARADAALAASKATVLTFKQCAEAYIEAQRSGWKSEKHAEQWTATLAKYAYPVIGALPVSAIDTALIMKVLQPIWTTRTETASRVRQRIERVLDSAKVQELRGGENPARWVGHLDHLLPKRSAVAPAGNHAALPYRDLPTFMARLRQRDGFSARALEFTILTAARTGETIGATWGEIDIRENTWTVPAARLKGRRGVRRNDHVVPLSDRALAILKELPEGEDADAVFLGESDGSHLSNMAMAELLKEMGYTGKVATVHGFRSTFKDWASEQTAYANELSEMALSHTVSDKVEAAYRRGDMRDRRRRLMSDWSRYCETAPRPASEKVTHIRGASRKK
jgi:integrase